MTSREPPPFATFMGVVFTHTSKDVVRAESDQLNNRLCINVDAFLTGVSEAESSSWSVSPNPADNFINIRIDDAKVTAYQGVIINGSGESVESFELSEDTTQIDLVDYLPGIYFLQMRNTEGAYFSRKFSVIH